MEENAKQLAELLKLLANENRLLIFCALMEQPMNVGEIAQRVPGITTSALSQHLTLLKAHRVLDNIRSGQNITYFIADHRVEEIMHTLKQYYCV
jgi:DNA-binding transcriptional ArsR family regulator